MMQMPTDRGAPITLARPDAVLAPVILTSPHSGRRYEARFLASSRLDAQAIRRSEDSFVEELFGGGPAAGMPLLAAEFPRAWCDANREAWELDPGMFADPLPDFVNTGSSRVNAGLGTIPRIVGNGETIYGEKLRFAEAQARVAGCWEPFHAALRGLIDETVQRFGTCLVIDCHSMPSVPGRTGARPDIVLGDGFGTTCGPAVTSFARAAFEGVGLNVRCNDPYAGGYITRHYGRPREGVQAMQIEVARGLYMAELSFTKTQGFAPLQSLLTGFLAALGAAALGLLEDAEGPLAAAAE
jgi:N-formylglutamate deformylase